MVLLLDEASSGLDSASTLALITSMAAWARLLNTTVVMALQQPEPAVLQQFDDALLLSQGHTLWHGPVAAALQHFEGVCGLYPLPGQHVLDFLQQVAGAGGGGGGTAAALQQQQQQQQPERSQLSCDDDRAALDTALAAAGPAGLSALFWASPQGEAMQVGHPVVRPGWPCLLMNHWL
jgi:ABC-type multidrug transport system ATPase subunit